MRDLRNFGAYLSKLESGDLRTLTANEPRLRQVAARLDVRLGELSDLRDRVGKLLSRGGEA